MGSNQKYKQIKIVEGYPYNRLDEEWEVNSVTDTHFILRNGNLGFGIEKYKLSEYFEEAVENQNQSNYLNEEGIRIIRNGVATIVILPDGSKGISKCLPEDEYDAELGYEIAYTKAHIKRLTKKLKKLTK